MKTSFLNSVLAATMLMFHLSAPAADIDLYTNIGSSTAGDLPNVLFIVDNTANWNTAFTNEMAALANTFANLPENKFNIGVMFSAETGSSDNNVSGGYVRAAIRTMNSANKTTYASMISALDVGKDKGNGGVSSLVMAEAYRYFSGGAAYAGNNKAKADYTGNTGADWSNSATTAASKAAMQAIYALSGNALASKSASTYNSPIVSGSCAKNYIIYISNGAAQDNSTVTSQSNAMLTAAGGSTTTIALSPSGSQDNPSDEWARFMKSSSLGVVTYTIDVNPDTTGQGPGWTALLKSMSGLSNYVAVSSSSGSSAIAAAVNDALSKIQSVNSAFAAVSLPASANVQGTYLNQLYIGMFRPDPDTKPRWMGNLKQYKLGTGDNLVDADGVGAINSQNGFISECARSYWTPLKTSTDRYWANDPKGTCIPPGSDADLYARSNTPDGNIVEKGAQAYVLRGGDPTDRTVKTCSITFALCTALLDFNNTNVTTTNLGAADSTERDLLINWAKGQNVDAELGKTTTEMRPSAHGDVIHSNPLALSFGSDVAVFYGSNDGMLHAINGNQSANFGSVAPGGELWAFMPPEFFGNLKRLRENTPLVSITPPVGEAMSGSAKPYSIDGPISAYKDSTHTWIYAAMRRGGRALYAFDVTSPASPQLKWKKGCPNLADDTGCLTGFTGIGQTWSLPQPVKVSGYSSGTAPVLIMGGGYDNCEDGDPHTCTTSTKGHKIFVLDADTGAVLTTLNTDRSVVGDVKVVPDASGFAKYAYAADLGGNIYRITIDSAAPADWTITKIASLGCATATSCTDNRKFMFAPSVVPETDGSYSLFIGSGDREKPLGSAYFPHAAAVTNYFFKVKDKPADATWLSSEAVVNCPGQSVICLNSLLAVGSTSTGCSANPAQTDLDASKGWVLGLRATEQVVTPAATRFGVTTFSTHMPAVPVSGSCASNLGTTHVYNLNIANASPTAGTTCNDVVTGGGLPPPPEKKDVCMNADCSVKDSICIGCSKDSPIQSQKNDLPLYVPGQNAKRRVYWYIQK